MKNFDLSVYKEKKPDLQTRDGRKLTSIRVYETLRYISYRIEGDTRMYVAGLRGRAYGSRKELDIMMS